MREQFICTVCGHMGNSKKVTKGSFILELFLWCLFLIPGLIYSIWRQTSKTNACPKCSSVSIIPLDTPMGQKLLKEQTKV